MYGGKIFLFVLVGLICSLTPVIADQKIDFKSLEGIPNTVLLQEDVIGGGTPSLKALEEIKRQGFKSVIDLRTMLEGTILEQMMVKDLGIKYFNIPISGTDISQLQVDQLEEILSDEDNRPALLHCAVGGRVLALWELYEKRKQ